MSGQASYVKLKNSDMSTCSRIDYNYFGNLINMFTSRSFTEYETRSKFTIAFVIKKVFEVNYFKCFVYWCMCKLGII